MSVYITRTQVTSRIFRGTVHVYHKIIDTVSVRPLFQWYACKLAKLSGYNYS